jgi:hypothetical protein
MHLFVLASLAFFLLFFLVMACVNVIGMERKIIDAVRITEDRVKKIYESE